VVAVRSFPRRFRGLFLGLGDDESPDSLAARPAPDGTTGLGHLLAATEALAVTDRVLDQILVRDDPQVDAVPGGAATTPQPTGSVEAGLSELGAAADALAEHADRVTAETWARHGHTADGQTLSASDVLWQGVDAVVERLNAAERTLSEARRAR
jgi:hypothetical protein